MCSIITSALASAGLTPCPTALTLPSTQSLLEYRGCCVHRNRSLPGARGGSHASDNKIRIQGQPAQSCRPRVGSVTGQISARATRNSEPEVFTKEDSDCTSLSVVLSGPEYDALSGIKVLKAAGGDEVELLSLLDAREGKISVVVFLTHFADLSSWELAQKLVKKIIPSLDAKNIPLLAVGLGSPENAAIFSDIHKFPLDRLYADPDGTCYSALEFAQGAFPEASVSPYLKLLAMLAGIESPGTIPEVIRGYVGDRSSKPIFDTNTPFDILGTQYQRPFELATLRLFNMAGILPRWGELSPPKSELLTQQGGTIVFRGKTAVFVHKDTGILKYVDTSKLLALFQEE